MPDEVREFTDVEALIAFARRELYVRPSCEARVRDDADGEDVEEEEGEHREDERGAAAGEHADASDADGADGDEDDGDEDDHDLDEGDEGREEDDCVATGPLGFTYRTRQEGLSFYIDEAGPLLYVVTDPIAAFLGGVRGVVMVNGAELCLDFKGQCTGPVASYLVPAGSFTASVEVACDGGADNCTRNHSFFNKTFFIFPVPFQYARHGANTQITLREAAPFVFRLEFVAPDAPDAICLGTGPFGAPACFRIRPPVFAVADFMVLEFSLASDNPAFGFTDRITGSCTGVDWCEIAAGGALFGVGSDDTEAFLLYMADGICSDHRAVVNETPLSAITDNGIFLSGSSDFHCP